MRSHVLAVLLVFGSVQGSEGAEVLWFPFDHAETVDCGIDCYPGHDGLDYSCPQGTNIYAAIGGTVVTAIGDVPGQVCGSPNYGNYVKIQNDQYHLQVIEAHLLQGSVVVFGGNAVVAGQYIGKSSNSGYTMTRDPNPPYDYVCGIGGAYHLHLEVRALVNNEWTAVNPDTHDGGLWTDPLLKGNDTPPPPPPPTFACSLVPGSITLNPAGPYTVGETVQCQMRFKNEGTATWQKTSGPSYVELGSCDASGTIGASFFNYPCPQSRVPSWLNCSVPCTFSETSVAPGQTGTFTFPGRIRVATPGTYSVYFGPVFNGEIMPGWGQAHFTVAVEPPPALDLILRNPTTGNWYVRVSTGSAFAYPSGPNTPPDLWCAAWASDGGGYTFTPFVGDPNGDGFDDLIVRRSDANWYIAWNSGNASFNPQGAPLIAQWGTGDYTGRYTFLFADVTGDGADELVTYDAQNANWYVSSYNAGTYSYTPGTLWETWGGGIGVFQAMAGDFSGDGKADICLLNLSLGHWWVRLSSGSDFYQPIPDNWCPYWIGSGYQPLTGDWDGDGDCDIALLDPAAGNWWVRLSNGASFTQPTPDNWCPGWIGSGYLPFVGDFNDDWKTDIGLRNPALGDHWVRLANTNGTAFYQPTPDNWQGGWGASSIFQLLVGRFGGAAPGKRGPVQDETEPPPAEVETPPAFAFHSIIPNPFHSSAIVAYALPSASPVSLRVYSPTGRLTTTLVDGDKAAGEHVLSWQTDRVPAGVYFLRLEAGTASATQPVLVLR